MGASLGKGKTSHGAYQIIQEVSDSLEDLNYKTLKESFSYLKRKGLIRSLKEPIITSAGIQRLNEKIPKYKKKRIWDKAIYLVTYDIPEEKKKFRNQLRNLLKSIGAAPLQVSVWLTPYNPSKILKKFTKTSGFSGEIIVSCMGKDGFIGEESIKQLVNRIYKLEKINDRYREFIHQHTRLIHNKSKTIVYYLSILKDDPQLPFELLPEDWMGGKAHQLYKKLTSTN